jgi:deazaflavin-dependent oxidoreductase (nitroreductase family)
MVDYNAFNAKIIAEFRANGGKVGGQFAGAPMVLITTTGARSGQARTTPLVCQQDGKRVYIFASKGGAPKHPDWYHNLKKNPEITLEIGGDKYKARASELTGAERDRVYAEQARRMPQFAEYQAKTTRTIPVIALDRAG